MNRRAFMGAGLGTAAFAMLGAGAVASGLGREGADLPRRLNVKVAFVLGDYANVIDTAGPWEVFQDANPPGPGGFDLYTVAETADPVRMTGGMRVVPKWTFDSAPQPHVIVVPAVSGTRAMHDWLRRASPGADVVMSVCNGSFQLARAGLLDGLVATCHHDSWDNFERVFPKVKLHRGLRFVDNGRIATAGGLTSGIDLALHIVGRFYGTAVAAATANYMEHDSAAWRTPNGQCDPANGPAASFCPSL